MNILIIARRVLQQLRHDKRFAVFTIIIPLIIAYFLKLFFDTLPEAVSREAFVVPFMAYIVYFLTFILSALLLVQERIQGTLSRMLISGVHKIDIILGYVLGYLGLAVIQAAFVLIEVLWLFELNYGWDVIWMMSIGLFVLAVVSVLLGIFISTFARKEAHVIPFIPLLVVLPAFLSGLMADTSLLPRWAEIVGQFFPIRPGISVLKATIEPTLNYSDAWANIGYLAIFAVVLTVVGSLSFKERE
ncbi:MAG: ABC transporter permease [bacterium]